VTVVAKSGQSTAGEVGKGQFLGRNRRNLAKERIVRMILFPGSVAGVPNLCNDGCKNKAHPLHYLETW